MELKKIIQRTKEIRRQYSEFEKIKGHKPWGALERTQGFVGDVGALMKLMMAKFGYRSVEKVDEKIAHELSDCLYSILMIADELGIDLEREFGKTMDELENKIKKEIR